MSYSIILGKQDFLESLRGKTASFLLAGSVTKTCEIPNLSQAGIPGKLHLTPVLDAEFVMVKQVRSLENIATTPKGVPTPALITRAVHELKGFKEIELLNLGLETLPKIEHFTVHEFGLTPSEDITKGANIEALSLFEKGLAFAQEYVPKSDYTILAESVPAGTTTAAATAKVLGYKSENYFSSSYKNSPNELKKEVIEKSLSNTNESMDIFEKLGFVSDNMIIFSAGFILGLQATPHKLILAGGTQMASVLLVVNSVLKTMGGELDSSKISLCTTKWIAEDKNSNIKAILEQLDFKINLYASDFDFSLSSHLALKLYDEGEAKEGVGCGAALCYASINGITKEQITQKTESFLNSN
ncbi:MAG: TIGR00303 family protein [Arcobacteraceae bacterium]